MKKIELEISDSMFIELCCGSNRLRCSMSELAEAVFLKHFWDNPDFLSFLIEKSNKPLN